ncbi:membrane protein [Microtetraspora sp. NBRC 13810]|uniref:lysylphosphatidylglycerol synthase transmembrane domain-containing protein n=1 Tax=Microtetraspora sp. NBRC 13810 TaxID=3030990 RepID=UPI0024A59BFE|nr:YbhN family protein [Microtetraspora sp. NBRC 13810]GLW10408.1 membrane protein [Microtetraspora sp. NBRC 13810]
MPDCLAHHRDRTPAGAGGGDRAPHGPRSPQGSPHASPHASPQASSQEPPLRSPARRRLHLPAVLRDRHVPAALRRWIRILLPVALVGVAGWTLRDQLPAPSEILATAQGARPQELALAVAAVLISLGMFARQQRRVLHAYGVTMPVSHAMALSYARTAMAAALPAGSAVSAGYAYRTFRSHGAGRTSAASVTVVSGAVSMIGLLLLYVAGTAVTAVLAPGELADVRGPLLGGAALLLVVGIVLHAGRPRAAHAPRRRTRLAERLAPVTATVRSIVTLPRADTAAAVNSAVLSWLFDLACLQAAVLAFGLHIDPVRLAATYLAAQMLRQIPLTPGGIGIIETSLIAGLTAAGVPVAPATAAVLIYRLLTCWLILPLGLASWALLRRAGSPRDDADAS